MAVGDGVPAGRPRGRPVVPAYSRPSLGQRRRGAEVAGAVVRALDTGRFDQVLPRWLRVGTMVRGLAPGLYAKGLLRDAASESAALAERFPADG